jgi:tetratricopeptide (TPR) repeat protein
MTLPKPFMSVHHASAACDLRRLPRILGVAAAAFCLLSTVAQADPRTACYQSDDPELVVQACTILIGQNAKDDTAYEKRGIAYTVKDDLDRAMADLNAAIAINARSADYFEARGTIFYNQKNYAAAADDYTKAIALESYEAKHFNSRAAALLAAGKADQALADAEKARGMQHGDADILVTRGMIYAALGRRDDAIADFRLALRIDPNNADAPRQLLKLGAAVKADAAPPVADVKSIAAPAGAKCAPGQAADAAAFAQTAVTVQADAARVGQPLAVNWTTNGAAKDPRKPAYLIVTMDDAVRFDGRGFFALGAGAPNPTGISFGKQQMRVVVPLQTAFAKSSGTLAVLPYRAGPFSLAWSVVGLASCGEWTAAQGNVGPIDVNAGAPQLAVHDDFADDKPLRIVDANKGPYSLHVFKDRFEVYDKTSGALVLKRQGVNPTFSPTGRFLIDQPPEPETFDVIDLVANRIVGRYIAEGLAWSHADSFLYVLGSREAWLRIVRTFHGVRTDAQVSDLAAEGPDGGSDYPTIADSAASAGLDIDAHPASAGLFDHASDRWAFDLSVTKGTVTFVKLDPADNGYAPDKIDPEIYVFDLGANAPQLAGEVIARRFGAETAAFGAPASKLRGWNTGDTLWLTSVAEQGGDTAAERQAAAQSLKDTLDELRPLTPIKADPTGKPATASGQQKPAQVAQLDATLRGKRRQVARDIGSRIQLLGPRLDLLPHRAIAALRSSRDRADVVRIGQEIAPLYGSSVATFKDDQSDSSYSTQPFVDPAVPRDANADADDGGPVEFNFAKDGRDLWRWTLGAETYWLTQTVQSGRNGFRFDFTLLNARPGAAPRFADLIKAASDKSPNTASRAPFDQMELGDIRTDLTEAFEQPSIVGVSGDRYLTLLTRPLPRLLVFDLKDWRLACAIPGPIDGANAASVVMHADQRHVTQINADGSVYVYACDSGDTVLSGAYVDDELVVMDRNGYFDGSDDAAGYVEVAIPGLPGRHLLSQFTKVLQRSGVAADALAGKTLPPPSIKLPPVLRLASAAKSGEVDLEAYSPSGLDQIQLYAGGRLYKRIDAQGNTASVAIPAAEIAHTGTLTAIDIDKNGLVSAPLTLPGTAGATKHGRLFVLAVGVNHYPNIPAVCGNGQQSCDLAYAVSDAKRVAAAAAKSPLYVGNTVSVLTDAGADRAAILAAFDRIIAEATGDDTILLSFAAHGLAGDHGGLYLGLSSTDLDRLEDTALPFDLVAERLRASKARVVVLLDVCYAGLADRATIATNDAAASRLVTNSGASIVVLSASKGSQTSLEDDQAGGGLFSVAFERILLRDRRAYDADRDGFISVDELYSGLKSSVVRASNGWQTPWLSRNLVVGDFDVF